MVRHIGRTTAILSLLMLALCASCGGGGGTVSGSSATRHFRSLLFDLTTPKLTFAKGEMIPLHFTVTNVGSRPVSMAVDACQAIFLVTNGTQPVSGVFCGVPEGFILTFAPGETRTFDETWNQRDANAPGNQVPAGQYTITMWLLAHDIDGTPLTNQQAMQELASGPVQLTIGL